MARYELNPRRNTDRPDFRTNGSAAYDIRRGPTPAQNDGSAAPKLPEPQRKPRPKARPKAQPRPKAKLSVSPVAIAGMLAVACLLLFVVCGYVQLFEESSHIAELKTELAEADALNERLQATYDSKVDLDEIARKAAALGMTEPNSRQTVYLNLQGTDRAVINEGGSENVVQTAWDAIVRSVRTLKEYFS